MSDPESTDRHPPLAGVVGWPVAHSKSPLIFAHWFAEAGIHPYYFILTHVVDEEVEDYDETLDMIRNLAHLPPPATVIGTPVNQPVLGLSFARLNLARRIAPASAKAPQDTASTQNWPEPTSTPPNSIPAFSTSIDGATPKEIRSDMESNSAPKLEVALRSRATMPSRVSSRPHQTISQAANSILPNCVETIDDRPSTRLRAVTLLGMVYRIFNNGRKPA